MLSLIGTSGAVAHRGLAAGTSTAIAVAADASPGAAVGAAIGTSTVAGILSATIRSIGLSEGIAIAAAHGADASPGAAVGAASGTSTAAGIGRATGSAAGVSAGLGTATANGGGTASSVGAASGTSTAAGIGSAPRGISAGVATATAVASSTAASAGASAGIGSASATATGIAPAAGTSAGTATAAAVGATASATSWNTALTGRGPGFAFSNANLTVVGKPKTLGIALDLDNKRIWGRVNNGAWTGTSGNPATNTGGNDITSVVSGSVFPAFSPFNLSATTINTGGSAFEGDVPAGFSAIGGTWDSGNKDASITLSNGSLTATGTASSAWKSVRGTVGKTSGKWYFELTGDFVDASNGWMGGVENASGSLSNYLGSTANGAGWQSTNSFYLNAGNPGGNLLATITKFANSWRSVRSTTSHISGKYYVEITCDAVDGANGWMAGVTNVSGPLANFLGSDNNSAGYQSQQSFWKNNSSAAGAPNNLTATHVLCLAIDLDHNRVWARVDGNAWSGTSGNPATNTGGADIASVNDGVGVYLGFSGDDSNLFDGATLNLGPSFAQTPPAGFAGW